MQQPMMQMIITVDNAGNVDMRNNMRPGDELQMIGALDIAKNRVRDAAFRNLQTAGDAPPPPAGVPQSKRVGKQEAISQYLKARKTIEARIQAINKSDPKATFEIDPQLLSAL